VSESPDVVAARLAAIVESSDDAIVSKTLDGIVQSWNQAAERLFGYSAAEIIGKSITLIIPEDRQAEEKDILARVVRGERLDHFETLRRRKDGTLVDISLTVSPIKDAGGRIIGASKIARDISERKRDREEMARLFILARVEVEERKKAEDRVRELNQELESRVRARTADLEAFSYTIAHDLRAPLRAIHRFSDVLLEDYAERLDEEGRDYLARLAGGAARMDRLIADLLDYSRVARAQVDPRPVDLAEVLSDVRDHLASEIQEKHARLIVQNGLHALLADKILLTQILRNLIANALKFVPAGDDPRGEGERPGAGPLRPASGRGQRHRHRPGASPADLPALRAPARDGRLPRHGRRARDRAKGRGTDERTPGPGQRARPGQPVLGRRPGGVPVSLFRVLLVEDDANDVLFLKRAVAKLGLSWTIDVASDGEEAVRKLAGEPPATHVLLDLKIPLKSGLEVLAALRADPRTRDLPVTVLTSSKEESDSRQAALLGIDGYVIKPVSFPDLLISVQEIDQAWRPRSLATRECPSPGATPPRPSDAGPGRRP
jgi:PAS domain S-box-containing protein